MVDFTQRAAGSASEALMNILCPALDQAVAAHAKAEYEKTRGSGEGDVAKKRIGSGYIGLKCARALAFKFHKFPVEERDGPVNKGELQRHAESGHWTEAKTADWLRLVGFQIRTDTGRLNTFGKPEQIGWKAARDPETGQYQMAGEVDGVIDAVPENLKSIIKVPAIWESKKGTDKKWKKFCKEKVKGADPKYFGQLQSNMAHMGVEQTVFSMLNLDNMKYYFEIVALDVQYAQGLVDRAVNVIRSTDPFELPPLCRSADDFEGKYCDWHGQCQLGLKLQPPEPQIATMVMLPADATSEQVAQAFGNLMNKAPPTPQTAPKRPVFNPNWK